MLKDRGDIVQVDYVSLGKRIAKRRKQLGLTQIQVNELAGLSDKYLSNIETDRSIPSIDVLIRICKALSVTPDYLLVGTLIKENMELSEKTSDKSNKTEALSDTKLKLLESFTDWLIENEM